MGNEDGGRRIEVIAGVMIPMRLGGNDIANRLRSEFFDGSQDRTGLYWGLAGIDDDDALLGYDDAGI